MGSSFQKLADRLGELSQIPSRVTARVAVRINAELRRQFEDGTDPYGDAWAPLADSTIKRKGHATIMVDSGDLARETRAIPMGGAGIELVSLEHGEYHMEDVGERPARPMLPNREELPDSWQEIIEDEYAKAFRKVMR